MMNKQKINNEQTYRKDPLKTGDIVICSPPLINTQAYDEFLDDTNNLRLRKGIELKVLDVIGSNILVEISPSLLSHFTLIQFHLLCF